MLKNGPEDPQREGGGAGPLIPLLAPGFFSSICRVLRDGCPVVGEVIMNLSILPTTQNHQIANILFSVVLKLHLDTSRALKKAFIRKHFKNIQE